MPLKIRLIKSDDPALIREILDEMRGRNKKTLWQKICNYFKKLLNRTK